MKNSNFLFFIILLVLSFISFDLLAQVDLSLVADKINQQKTNVKLIFNAIIGVGALIFGIWLIFDAKSNPQRARNTGMGYLAGLIIWGILNLILV